MPKDVPPLRDLGLTYLEAAHGVQSAVGLRMSKSPGPSYYEGECSPKHLRVGIDLSKAEQWGLVKLLIDKGVFTLAEYREYMRLAVNEELAAEEEAQGVTFR